MIFVELCKLWVDIHCIGKQDATKENCNSFFRCHIFTYFSDVQCKDIDERTILEWIEYQKNHGNLRTGGPLSQNQISKGLGYLKNIFELAIEKKILSYNPAAKIFLPKAQVKKYEIYSKDEINKLIISARPKWLGDMILLAYHTGMRRGEVYGLQWNDIDFKKQILHVQRSVSAKYSHDIRIGPVKTKKSDRYIMFDSAVLSMFLKRKSFEPKSSWVFTNKNGDVCSPVYSCKYFKSSCMRAGIPPRRFHDLRHTHITELVKAGIPLPIIQQRAGHSNINTTMEYAHVCTDMQQCVISYMENIK